MAQQLRCWGSNINGQSAYGSNVTIGDDEAADSAGFISTGSNGSLYVATGNNHSCSISTDNDVNCWGLNAFGQLGLGHTNKIGDDESINGVSAVNLGISISQVTTGANHTCALTKDEGKVICWGHNSFGQLGIGNTSNQGDDELPSIFVSVLPQ